MLLNFKDIYLKSPSYINYLLFTTMATPKAQQKKSMEMEESTQLSPSINSRKDEKEQMVNLNNRLAVYVDRVRSLENENMRLRVQITNFEEASSSEVDGVKSLYEGELAEARRLLDELSKEKAQLQIVATSYHEKYESGNCKANELIEENAMLCDKLKEVHETSSSQELQYSRMKIERDTFAQELETLKGKLCDVKEELESIQKVLENETLLRVDFENKLQSAKEELLFKERVLQEELFEVRKRHVVGATKADDKADGVCGSQLEAAIMDLREQQAADLEELKEDLEQRYGAKIISRTQRLDNACQNQVTVEEKFKAAELKINRLQANNKLLINQISTLNDRLQELELQVDTEKELRASAISNIEKQRDEARKMLGEMEKEYNELFDLKVKLDHEIGIYRKLLEEEEHRLHLSPSATESTSRTRTRRKRKRATGQSDTESSAKKQEIASKETIVVEKTQRNRKNEDSPPEGNNSCTVM